MKYRWLILPLAVILACCGKEKVELPNKSQAGTPRITFASKFTRGSVIDTEPLLAAAGGFNVWALSHAGGWNPAAGGVALLDGKVVTSPDGYVWSYEGPVDWPEADNMSFFAYGPANAAKVVAASAGKTPEIEYTVPLSPADQKDLLVAVPVYDQSGANYGNSQAVRIQFHHALSRIRFSALLDAAMAAGEQVKVKSVTLTNLYKSGTAPLTYDTQASPPISWTPLSPKENYTVAIGGGLKDTALDASPREISAEGGMLFLLPQTIQRAEDMPTMNVTLSVGGSEVDFSTQILSPAAWVAGKSYDYQILVHADGIEAIVIDSGTTLEGWNQNPEHGSIIIQSVVMTGASQSGDVAGFYNGLANLNTFKGSAYANSFPWFNYQWFALYATYDVEHDITIDMSAASLGNFTKPGDKIIFDFKKTVDLWKTDAGDNPYKVTVNYNNTQWKLSPAFQIPDGHSGATLPHTYVGDGVDETVLPSNVITRKGSIIFEKL